MNTRKVKEIIKFDIEKSIQNKWFVILNVFVFISILLATNWSNISSYLSEHNINIISEDEVSIQVVDSENLIFDKLNEKYSERDNFKIEKLEENPYSKDNIPEDDVILIEIHRDDEKMVTSKVVAKEVMDSVIQEDIYKIITDARSRVFAEKNNITVESLNILSEEPDIKVELLGVDAENSDTKEIIKLVSIVIVYMVLIIVLSRIASEIAQEKVSKSIEYVLTSVSAKEYLLAKVLGTTFTIVIQIIYTVIYYMVGKLIANLAVETQITNSMEVMNVIDFSVISYVIAMIAYLIFTVFLTTLIQATLSSRTTSVAEAGNTTLLLMSIIVILYFASISAISPYITVTPFMYIISCLPLVSTFFVPAMMIIGQATMLQIIISFVLLILVSPLIFNLCSKYFKNGILDYTTKKKHSLFSKVKKNEMSLKEKQDYDLRSRKASKFAFVIGMAMILFVILELLSVLALGAILPSIFNGKVSKEIILIIENSLGLVISLGLSTAFIKLYCGDEASHKKKVDVRNKFTIILIGIAILAIVQFVLNIIYPRIGLDYDALKNFTIGPNNPISEKIVYIICIAVVPAIFEELLFRKAILNSSKRFGNGFAVVFSAFLFAIYHMNFNQAIFAFIIGILFGVIAIKTNSIKYTGLLHFLNNGYSAIITISTEGSIALGIFNDIVYAIIIMGIILLIKNLPNLRKLKREDFEINKDCRLLLKNYTFIVAIIILIAMFASTEHLLIN